jgi:hypothetical protein
MVESQSNDDHGPEEDTDMTPIDLVDATKVPAAPTDPAAALTPEPARPQLAVGTKVEVRRRFDDKWASGFEVAETTPLGYRLRRLSDGEMIPVPFPADVVRREKKRSTWWY